MTSPRCLDDTCEKKERWRDVPQMREGCGGDSCVCRELVFFYLGEIDYLGKLFQLFIAKSELRKGIIPQNRVERRLKFSASLCAQQVASRCSFKSRKTICE